MQIVSVKTTINPKVLVASKGDAQLIRQSGQVYCYPDGTATCALFVCNWSEMEPQLWALKEDGWEVAR
jgi:hypothetical protein